MLPKDKVYANLAEIGKTIKAIPVTDKVIEVDVAEIIPILSTDSNMVLKFYVFQIALLIYGFCLWSMWSVF